MRHLGCARSILIQHVLVLAALVYLPGGLLAQPSRITGQINASRRFALSGHVHPNVKSEYDQGKADASLELSHVTLVLKPSDSQRADLDKLLAEQQDPTSKNYHNWLTPEAYADRFGVSQDDINAIVKWLQSQSLTVTSVARARTAVAVSGTAAQIEGAFKTEIHIYQVDDETHYANSTEPSLPAAMQGVVQAIHGLHNFRLKARTHRPTMLGVSADGVSPNYTSSSAGDHYLAPDDFAIIFNIQLLYDAGINGSGQNIVVVGQSRIVSSHLATFRSYFGLPTANLTTILVPNTRDPGTIEGDAEESDLDLQWASAVARSASLIFVYSYDVIDAVQYAIDQNLAPVISMSYGECESSGTRSDAMTMQTWAKQGNAQGITWVAASGDSGGADCYQSSSGRFGPSSNLSLATDVPASIPEVTGVGGTTLNEGTGTYWNGSNDSTTKASVLSYIPETAWNDSAIDGTPAASGGGASTFFSKPSWQTGTGVPSDGARDVPDVALPASADHDGYLVYTTANRQTRWYVFGGTSAGAPTFSGMTALLNHYLVANGYQSGSGLGNVNTQLYRLAAAAPGAFHDIVTGDNIVSAPTCVGRRCSSSSTTSVGYSTMTAYDQVTGLGSIDTYNLVTAWPTVSMLTKASSSTPCTLSLSPGAATFDTPAGSGSIAVTAGSGCSWSASTTETWIEIASDSSGSGSGSVTYTVSANTTGTVRTGAILIGSASFTVTQTTLGSTALFFVPITPCRLMDTRVTNEAFGGTRLAASETRTLAVPSGGCPIPANAAAYSMNVAVAPVDSLGYLTLWPAGLPQPLVSTLNSADGRIKSNAAIVAAGDDGAINLFVTDATEVILDINGYFVSASSSSGLAFYPITPCRAVDTRLANGDLGGPAMLASQSRTFPLRGSCGLPATAQVYAMNISAVPRLTLGYLTAWPTGAERPLVATLNATTGTVTGNAAILAAGTSGSIDLYASDDTDVVIDISGYFAPANAGGLSFYAVTPCRLADTRLADGGLGGPQMEASETRAFPFQKSACTVSSAAQAYVVSAAVVPAKVLGYLTLWATGTAQPLVATLNASDGAITSNAAIVPAGTDGSINAFVTDATHLIFDLTGFFAP